jgi:polar amino acid transport system substrate-binding protein
MHAFSPLRGAALLVALLFALPAAVSAQSAAPAPDAATVAVPPPTSTLDKVRRAGVLRVGVVVGVPWTMAARDGQLIGFDIDVAQELARDLGVRLELVRNSSFGVVDDLLDGRTDIAAAGLWPNPRQALSINFTDPYGRSRVTLVANRKRAGGFKTLEAFNRPEVTIGVRGGSLAEQLATRQLPRATLKRFDSDEGRLAALLAGELHAVVASSPSPEFLQSHGGDKLVLPPFEPLGGRSEAFGIARGDVDFYAFLNAWIRNRTDAGWLPERRRYWFSGFDWEKELL